MQVKRILSTTLKITLFGVVAGAFVYVATEQQQIRDVMIYSEGIDRGIKECQAHKKHGKT
jgi:hypothetical protein